MTTLEKRDFSEFLLLLFHSQLWVKTQQKINLTDFLFAHLNTCVCTHIGVCMHKPYENTEKKITLWKQRSDYVHWELLSGAQRALLWNLH